MVDFNKLCQAVQAAAAARGSRVIVLYQAIYEPQGRTKEGTPLPTRRARVNLQTMPPLEDVETVEAVREAMTRWIVDNVPPLVVGHNPMGMGSLVVPGPELSVLLDFEWPGADYAANPEEGRADG